MIEPAAVERVGITRYLPTEVLGHEDTRRALLREMRREVMTEATARTPVTIGRARWAFGREWATSGAVARLYVDVWRSSS